MKPKRMTWHDRLGTYTDRVSRMRMQILSLPKAERLKLRAACRKAGETNCGWLDYQTAQFILNGLLNRSEWLRP